LTPARPQRRVLEIWDLFAFQPSFTDSLSASAREFCGRCHDQSGDARTDCRVTSLQNECRFCTRAHAAAAAELLGSEDLVPSVLNDLEASALEEKDKAMLRYVTKIPATCQPLRPTMLSRCVLPDGTTKRFTSHHHLRALQLLQSWITATGVAEMSKKLTACKGSIWPARLRSRGEPLTW